MNVRPLVVLTHIAKDEEMNPFIGMGVQLGGNLLSGLSKKKAAKKLRNDIIKKVDERQEMAERDTMYNTIVRGQDQERAIQYRKDDEARLKEATGIDFQKLRDDAQKAGFNPLTALQLTGGAGYDGRGAVLTTPFMDTPERHLADYDNTPDLLAGVGGTMVDSAGYFGDAIAGLGSNLIGLSADQAARAHEVNLAQMQLNGRTPARTANGGGTYSGGTYMGADRVTASPVVDDKPFWERWMAKAADAGYGDRDHLREPYRDMTFTTEITDADGTKTTMINPDLDLDGPVSWLNGFWVVGSMGAQNVATHMLNQGKWLLNKAAPATPPNPNNGWTVNPSNGMWVIK